MPIIFSKNQAEEKIGRLHAKAERSLELAADRVKAWKHGNANTHTKTALLFLEQIVTLNREWGNKK